MSQFPPSMHVLPIESRYPNFNDTRPGLITPIGVMSIIVAALTAIACLSAIMFAFATFMVATTQKYYVTATVANYPVSAVTTQNDNPNSLNDFQAQQALAGLKQSHRLSPKQSTQVQTLLHNYGKKMFSFDAGKITAARVKDNVSESGEFLGGQGKMSVFYNLGNGRIEVSDSIATFRAEDNEVYRSTDSTSDNSLTEDTISAAIGQLQLNVTPNEDQLKSLREQLRDPNQAIIDSTNTAMIRYGSNFPDNSGGIWFITNNSIQVRIDKEGKITLLNSAAPQPGTNPFSGKKITTGWASGLLGISVLNGLIAIVLLVAAIQFLRGRPIGRKLHLVYSWLQLPVIILAALMIGMTTNEWIAAQSKTANPNELAPWIIGILASLVGIIWPMICLIVMTRKTVRDYFVGVR